MQKVLFKNQWLIVVLLTFYSLHGYANQQITHASIDSLSLLQYLNGDWDAVIQTGKIANENNIDYKLLQQRLGYAYFMKQAYYKSMHHYEKALKYDSGDEITRLYLYYNGLNTGRFSYARFNAAKLSDETKQYIELQNFRPLDAVDLEFSYKVPQNDLRENAFYKRFGLNSMLGYQFNLYQSISEYNQTISEVSPVAYSSLTRQNEYLALINWNPSAKTSLNLGYHFVGTSLAIIPDTFYYPGNLFYGKLTQQLNRFDFSVSGATFNNDWIETNQVGLHAGIGFAGKNNIYFKSSYFRMFETALDFETGLDNQTTRDVFKQTAGIFFFNHLWTEASVTLGNLNHFIDNNGLYIYNSLDQTTFKSGLSVFGYLNKHLTLYINYTFEKKLMVTADQTYNQHALSGGMIWKI